MPQPNLRMMISIKNLSVRYGALCHDLGKAVTTKKHDGVLRSFNHAQAGVPIAKKMMARITRQKVSDSRGTKISEIPFSAI